jgi:hypothetical protein
MSTEMSTSRRDAPSASGPTVFAAAVMVISGVCVLFAGTAALVHDRIYVVVPDYIYSFNLTGWAWVHLALGILAIAAGYALLRDRSWARVAGMSLACLSMVFQFLVLPFYPIWSVLIIALDATILWALTTDGRNAVQDSGSKRPHGRAT